MADLAVLRRVASLVAGLGSEPTVPRVDAKGGPSGRCALTTLSEKSARARRRPITAEQSPPEAALAEHGAEGL